MVQPFRPLLRSLRAFPRPLPYSSHLALPLLHRAAYLSTDARSKIQSAVDAHPLVVFMKGTPTHPQCGFSRAVVQLLEMHGVDPEKVRTFNCLEDQELREGIKEFSDWPTIPQVYVDGEFQGGCDTMMEMHKTGDLERLLVEKKLTKAPLSETLETAGREASS